MLVLLPRTSSLDSFFKEVKVFKAFASFSFFHVALLMEIRKFQKVCRGPIQSSGSASSSLSSDFTVNRRT